MPCRTPEEARERAKKYYEANKEKCKERFKKYQKESAEKIAKRKKQYYENNKDAFRERRDRRKKENKEGFREYQKLHSASAIKNLSDSYVALTMRLPVLLCPPELLEAKRLQLMITRELRKKK